MFKFNILKKEIIYSIKKILEIPEANMEINKLINIKPHMDNITLDLMALIDNKMAMHGRRPFTGERKRQVLVALAAAA